MNEFDLGADDELRNADEILHDKSTTHTNYVMLCATTKLDKDYTIDDPNSELCLATARVAGQREGECSLRSKKSICNDTLFSELEHIPETDSKRLERLVEDIDKLQSEKNQKAYEQPAVTVENIDFFRKKGLSEADAKGCVYALSFYTGDKANSDNTSRGGSLLIRRGNMHTTPDQMEEFLEKARMIIYYLVQALKHLPFYWGVVTRMIYMKKKDLEYYKPGHIVTWLQFSSSCRGERGAAAFKDRNVKVIIWSIKGRHIDQFSNWGTRYGHDEDEVLFLPFTRLLVLKVLTIEHSYVIYCRELELGITRGFPLLWVDDEILNPAKEMKRHMEAAQIERPQELKFILKPSTELAIAYLRSPFGQRHTTGAGRKALGLGFESNLRIITDMARPTEEEGDRAGAKLVKSIEQARPSFDCPIMIFTSNAERGAAKLQQLGIRESVEIVDKEVSPPEPGVVYVTTSAESALAFCQFSDVGAG